MSQPGHVNNKAYNPQNKKKKSRSNYLSAQELNDALLGIFSARVNSSTAVYQRRGVRRHTHVHALPLSVGAALVVSNDALLDILVIMLALTYPV